MHSICLKSIASLTVHTTSGFVCRLIYEDQFRWIWIPLPPPFPFLSTPPAFFDSTPMYSTRRVGFKQNFLFPFSRTCEIFSMNIVEISADIGNTFEHYSTQHFLFSFWNFLLICSQFPNIWILPDFNITIYIFSLLLIIKSGNLFPFCVCCYAKVFIFFLSLSLKKKIVTIFPNSWKLSFTLEQNLMNIVLKFTVEGNYRRNKRTK